MAHNGIIKGNLLYISYYHDGLRIFDISDPYNPNQIVYYDTYTPSSYNSYKRAWGVYPYLPSGNIIVSDMQTGLYVLDCPITYKHYRLSINISSIYPNPVISSFKVNNSANRIEITDISGRKIKEENLLSEKRIYRTNISNGLYIYHLFNEENKEIKKGKIIFQ